MAFPVITYKPLPHHIAAHALARPRHPAILDGDLTLDYAGLDDRIRRGAAKLRKLRVAKGDRVIIVAGQKTELMLGTFACMGAGAPVAPLSATEENVENLARYFNPAMVIHGTNGSPRRGGRLSSNSTPSRTRASRWESRRAGRACESWTTTMCRWA